MLPAWSTVGRWVCLGGFLLGMQLRGPFVPLGFALFFLALGVEALGARSAPKAPYPRMRRPLLALGAAVVVGLLAASIWADLIVLLPVGVALAIAYRLAMTRVTREAFPAAAAGS